MPFMRDNTAAEAGAYSEEITFDVTFYQTDARSGLKLINDLRASEDAWYWGPDGEKVVCENLQPYTYDYNLEQIAMQRAVEAAIWFNFDHRRPDGSSCVTCTYNGTETGGENLANAYLNTEGAFVAWCENDKKWPNQGHRIPMIADYFSCVGIARVKVNGWNFYAIEFGKTNSGAPATQAYDGVAKRTVTISEPLKIFNGYAVWENTEAVTYLGEMDLPVPTVTLGLSETRGNGIAAEELGGFTYEWKSNTPSVAVVKDGKLVSTGVGLAELTLTISSCGDTKTNTMHIGISPYNIAKITPVPIPDQIFTGSPITPKPEIVIRGRTLVEGEDYTLDYFGNTYPGEARIYVNAIGDLYEGWRSMPFNIVEAPVETPTLTPTPTPGIMIWETDIEPIPDQTYTGKQISPVIKITYHGRQLIPEQDYTFSYGMNIEPGQGYVNLWGIGEFDGSTRVFFNIVKPGQPTPTGKPGITPTNVPTPTSVPRITPSKGVTEIPTPTVEPGLSPSPDISEIPTPSEEPDISITPSPSVEPEISGVQEPTGSPAVISSGPSPIPTEAVPSISAPNPSIIPTSEQTIPTVSHLPEPESGEQEQHAHGPLIVWILLIVIVFSFILFLVWK